MPQRTGPQHTERHPPLLPEYTFVVQLHAGTPVATGQVAGRVEHLVSRQASTFESLEALLAFMARVLRDVCNPPAVSQDDLTDV